jgi:predicted transcriptional regulator
MKKEISKEKVNLNNEGVLSLINDNSPIFKKGVLKKDNFFIAEFLYNYKNKKKGFRLEAEAESNSQFKKNIKNAYNIVTEIYKEEGLIKLTSLLDNFVKVFHACEDQRDRTLESALTIAALMFLIDNKYIASNKNTYYKFNID